MILTVCGAALATVAGPRSMTAAALSSMSGAPELGRLPVRRADFDRWYALELQSCHAGWAHWVQHTADGVISTKLVQHLEIKRGGRVIAVESESEFVETASGKPVSLTVVESLAATPTTTVYRYSDKEITVSVTEGEGGARQPRVSARAPIAGAWLPPAAAAVFVQQRLEAGATEITARTIELGAGPEPVLLTRRVVKRATAEPLGKTVPALEISVSSSRPGSAGITETVDELGTVIRSTMRMGELVLIMTLTSREEARSRITAPELVNTMLVKADRTIQRPRQAVGASYVLTLEQGQPAAPEAPAGGANAAPGEHAGVAATETDLAARVAGTSVQTVERLDGGSVRVTVRLDKPAAAPAADAADERYRRASAYITSDDEEVRRLARRAVSTSGESRARRAEAVRRLVHTFIAEKDLSVGFATAAEVARTKCGDCTEHAVLVAAMLRSLEIPSRVVSGLVYADAVGQERHVFAYHMWTQALIESDGAARWVDLDATLPAEGAFDAAHIALVTTALSDEQPQDSLVKLLPLLGGLRIQVGKVQEK